MALVFLGEAIVDLIGDGNGGFRGTDRYRASFGGAPANAAVAAARAGAEAELAGGAGDDELGRWLRDRLHAEGVGTRWFSLIEGLATPVALIAFDADNEPGFQVYGAGIEDEVERLDGEIESIVAAADALVFGSNTLVGEHETELTLAAAAAAREAGVPVLFDPNLRIGRWSDPGRAHEICRRALELATVVKGNRSEILWLAGRDGDPGAAAEAVAALGPRLCVVTCGGEGAMVRGEIGADIPGVEVEMASPLGAGDSFTGTLAARMQAGGWRAEAAPGAAEAANRAAALTCTVREAVVPR